MLLGQQDIHMEENVVSLPTLPYIISKWVKNLNVEAKARKLLEENMGANLYDLRYNNGFLNMT